MKCPKCSLPLPGDSEFCQYCGAEITAETEAAEVQMEATPTEECAVLEESRLNSPADIAMQEDKPAAEIEEISEGAEPTNGTYNTSPKSLKEGKRKHCKHCGDLIDPDTKKCQGCGKQYFRAKTTLPAIVLALLLVAAVVLNILQFIWAQDNVARISELEELNSRQSTEITSQNRKIDTQKTTIDKLQKEVDVNRSNSEMFEMVCDELRTGTLGYAASNFHVDESVIVVPLGQKNRKFTLTAHWSNGGHVELDYSGFSAWVDFDKNSWSTSTTMTITPWEKGVTAVTFSNSVDSKTFKVIIIVTD